MSLLAVAGRLGRSMVIASSCAWILAGCSGGSGGSSTPASTVLSGTITGIIQDTSTVPVVGATVTYTPSATLGAPVSTTTDATGAFTLTKVRVSGISPANGSALTLSIAPASPDYTAATVQVTPAAQLESSNSGTGVTFANNFSANAGVITLMGLSTTVTGTLISASGVPVAAEPVNLDYESLESIAGTVTGVTVNLVIPLIPQITSDPSGNFTFTGVYNDSCVRVLSSNGSLAGTTPVACSVNPATDSNALTFATKDAAVVPAGGLACGTTTASGGTFVCLQNVTFTGFPAGAIAPYVTGVADVITSALPAILSSTLDGTTATGGITINFSEPINTALIAGICPSASSCSIYVAQGSAEPYGTNLALDSNTPYTFDSTGQFMTVFTASPLPLPSTTTAGAGDFGILIPIEAIQNEFGQQVTLGANGSEAAAIPYASFQISPAGGDFLALDLSTSTTAN